MLLLWKPVIELVLEMQTNGSHIRPLMLRNKGVGSSGDGGLPMPSMTALPTYLAACSSANKLITTSFAASNLERTYEASNNPKRLWTAHKSTLHSAHPNGQLSLPIAQSLANSLATFFSHKIVSIKDSVASKLHGSPTSFDFDLI